MEYKIGDWIRVRFYLNETQEFFGNEFDAKIVRIEEWNHKPVYYCRAIGYPDSFAVFEKEIMGLSNE